MKYIVGVDELKKKLDSDENMVLIDVRYNLLQPEQGRKAYAASHLPKAIYFDLKENLSGTQEVHGGNHPLPDFHVFSETLGKHGIDHETTVVVYGETSDIFAARAWWMIHHIGHNHVYVLDGGYNAWVEAGYPVTNEKVVHPEKNFTPKLRDERIVSMEDVRVRDSDKLLIDARDRERYLGGNNPLQNKSGHIPGAKNYFWKDVVDETGTFLSKQQLENYYKNISKENPVILSCGSGVSACVHLLLLKELGHKRLEFYPGSFSDWISYPENRVETKDEN